MSNYFGTSCISQNCLFARAGKSWAAEHGSRKQIWVEILDFDAIISWFPWDVSPAAPLSSESPAAAVFLFAFAPAPSCLLRPVRPQLGFWLLPSLVLVLLPVRLLLFPPRRQLVLCQWKISRHSLEKRMGLPTAFRLLLRLQALVPPWQVSCECYLFRVVLLLIFVAACLLLRFLLLALLCILWFSW